MKTILLKFSKNYFSHYTGLEKNIWHGIILNFAESTLVGFYYFLPIYFIRELHFDVIVASMLISFYGFGTIVGGYLGGRLSDKHTPVPICILSLFMQSFIFLLLVNLKSKSLLSLDLFLMGFCSYVFITSSHLFVLEKCTAEDVKLKAINTLNVASNLGLALSAVVIGYLAIFGFKIIFLLTGVALLGLTLYGFILIKNSNTPKHNKKNTDEAFEKVSDKKSTNNIFIIFGCTFAVGFIIFQANTTYSIYIQNLFPAYGLKSLSILFSLNSLMVVFLQTPVVMLFNHKNKMLLVGIGAFLIGCGYFILIYASVFCIAVLSCFLYTLGELLFFSIAQLICYESGKSQQKGSVMGLYRSIYATSRVAAPILGGAIFQYLGSSVLWCSCGALGIVCLVLCYNCSNTAMSNLLIFNDKKTLSTFDDSTGYEYIKYYYAIPKANMWHI